MDYFPTLFGVNGDESEEGVEEEQEVIGDSFGSKWGFLIYVDEVVQLTKHTLDYVMERMNILQLLNLVCYLKDKRQNEKESIEKYRKQ